MNVAGRCMFEARGSSEFELPIGNANNVQFHMIFWKSFLVYSYCTKKHLFFSEAAAVCTENLVFFLQRREMKQQLLIWIYANFLLCSYQLPVLWIQNEVTFAIEHDKN